MKRFAAFILLLIYFSTSTGATVHYHYCMGEVADFSLTSNNDETCGKCGMEKGDAEDNGCCKDEVKWIKIDNDQKTIASYVFVPKLEITTALVLSIIDFSGPRSFYFAHETHAPLRSAEIAPYLLNCTFRI